MLIDMNKERAVREAAQWVRGGHVLVELHNGPDGAGEWVDAGLVVDSRTWGYDRED